MTITQLLLFLLSIHLLSSLHHVPSRYIGRLSILGKDGIQYRYSKMDYSNLTQRLSPAWTKAQETVCPLSSLSISIYLVLPSPRWLSWMTYWYQTLLEPYTYISANPGKEIRSQLIEAFNLWLDVPEGDLDVIRGVVRMLHNASLLYVPFCLSSYTPPSSPIMLPNLYSLGPLVIRVSAWRGP